MGMPLLKQKSITVIDGEGESHNVIISKFPATEGLEINVLYPSSLAVSAIPKIGDYKIPRDLMRKIMTYVAVDLGNGNVIRLETDEAINSHLGDWEGLVKTILAIMSYNNSFFRNGTISDFFADIVQTYLQKTIAMLTPSSQPSSEKSSQASTS